MPLIPAEAAIHRFRRDLTFGRVVRGVFALALLATVMLPFTPVSLDPMLVLPVIACAFVALSLGSVKGSRLITDSPTLIAAGQFDEAERRIDQALRGFSLFRHVKVLGLHHLALLRHAQKNWHESALLCRALLGQKLGALQGIGKPARLMLADAQPVCVLTISAVEERLPENIGLLELDDEEMEKALGAMATSNPVPICKELSRNRS